METTTPMKIPMQSGTFIGHDLEGKSVDQKTYRGSIGSLLYLTAGRSDIVSAAYLCARF